MNSSLNDCFYEDSGDVEPKGKGPCDEPASRNEKYTPVLISPSSNAVKNMHFLSLRAAPAVNSKYVAKQHEVSHTISFDNALKAGSYPTPITPNTAHARFW